MSLTPVDKPPDSDETSGGLADRSHSVRAIVGRALAWMTDRLRGVHDTDGNVDHHATDVVPATTAQTPRSGDQPPLAEAPDSCGTIDGFPNRDHPLTYPGRNLSGINTPDVVSLETEDGLRLSVPENPDAEMTSDVWTTVEP